MAHISEQDKKFRAENDMRTLVEAAVIKNDKSRFDPAMKMVRKQRKAMSDIDKKST